VGVPHAVPGNHRVLHVRMHHAVRPSRGRGVLLHGVARLQEAGAVRLHAHVREWGEDVSTGSVQDVVCAAHKPADLHRIHVDKEGGLSDNPTSSSAIFDSVLQHAHPKSLCRAK